MSTEYLSGQTEEETQKPRVDRNSKEIQIGKVNHSGEETRNDKVDQCPEELHSVKVNLGLQENQRC